MSKWGFRTGAVSVCNGRLQWAVATIALISLSGLAAVQSVCAAELLDVTLSPALETDAAGRLLVFAELITEGRESQAVDASVLHPTAVAVAGQDLRTFGIKRRITIDLDHDAAPQAFSELPGGDYWMQVVLDPDGDYGRYGRNAGDIVSAVTRVHLPLPVKATIELDHVLPQTDMWDPPNASATVRERHTSARSQLTDFTMTSPILSSYWGRSERLQAWILLPKEYEAHGRKTWPVVYLSGAASSNYVQNLDVASYVAQMNRTGDVPPMIWVFLNYSTPTGTTEFADSVNNGPWESALMQELIPALEKRFRMDAQPRGRFLTGHSSGGWASIWLQTRHPDFFGGAWATAPDPCDFHDFIGVNLYEPDANMYFDVKGQLRPVARAQGEVIASFRDYMRLEEVLGHVGGQFQSFDWVFSPRTPDGTAAPMFNRVTGVIDPAVAAYWIDHYDITQQLQRLNNGTRRKLAVKLHVTVGDLDTFYLNGSVQRLQGTLQRLGLPADIHFLPGKNHNDLYGPRSDPLALLRDFARSMYAIARPSSSGHK